MLFVAFLFLFFSVFSIFNFYKLDYYVSWRVSLWLNSVWDTVLILCETWVTVSFPMLGKFPAIISSNTFLGPFFLLFLRCV